MTERPNRSLEGLQSRSDRISRVIGQRNELIGRISRGEVTPPSPTDLVRFERFIDLPDRLASNISALEARRSQVQASIEETQRARVRAIYERTLNAVENGKLSRQALETLEQTYPYLRAAQQEPAQGQDEPKTDLAAPEGTSLPDDLGKPEDTSEIPEGKAKKERKILKRGEKEFSIGNRAKILPQAHAEILEILAKRPSAEIEIFRKLYPGEPYVRGRIMGYISELKPSVLEIGLRVANKANTGKHELARWELQKVEEEENGPKPKRIDVPLGEDSINIQRIPGLILIQVSQTEESVPIEVIALEVYGAINSYNQSRASSDIHNFVNPALLEYGLEVINTSPNPKRNASYKLVPLGSSEPVASSTPEGTPDQDEQGEKRAKLLSSKETAHLAYLIKAKAEAINAVLAPQGVNVDTNLMDRLIEKYTYDPQSDKILSPKEMVKFRNELIEKVKLIFEYGLEDDLLDEAEDDVKEFVIFLYHLDFDMLKDLINEPGGLKIQVLGNHVEHIEPRYLDQDDTSGNTMPERPFTGRATPPTLEELSRRAVTADQAVSAPATAPAAAPSEATSTPTREPIFSPSRRRDRIPPQPARPDRKNNSPRGETTDLGGREEDRRQLREEFEQVFRIDPESDRTIDEIIGHTVDRIPEFRGGADRRVRSMRIAQAFNGQVEESAIEAAKKGVVNPAKRDGIDAFALDEVVAVAYLHRTDKRHAMSSRTRSLAIELVQRRVVRAQAILEQERAERISHGESQFRAPQGKSPVKRI